MADHEMKVAFVYKTTHATLEEIVDVTMSFNDETELDEVEFKHEDQVVIMSATMFFILLGADALELYEKAAEAFQNERMQS